MSPVIDSRRVRTTSLACLFAPLLFAATLQAAETSTPIVVPATWKPVDLQFSYHGFTTSYSCDGLEGRMEQILKAVGAHPNTRVTATGCPSNGPSDHAFVRITGGFPVPVTSEPPAPAAPGDKSRAELLKRLGVKPGIEPEQFPATQKTVDLSRDRAAGLEPGDCELMEQLTREVFPKLGLKVVESDSRCFPNQLPISTPRLKVSALIKAPAADDVSKQPVGGGKPH